jgi:hypothetical protein
MEFVNSLKKILKFDEWKIMYFSFDQMKYKDNNQKEQYIQKETDINKI